MEGGFGSSPTEKEFGDRSRRVRDNVLTNRKRVHLKRIPSDEERIRFPPPPCAPPPPPPPCAFWGDELKSEVFSDSDAFSDAFSDWKDELNEGGFGSSPTEKESGDRSRRVRDNVLTNRKRLYLKPSPPIPPKKLPHQMEYGSKRIPGGIAMRRIKMMMPAYEYKISRRVSEIETPYKPKLVSIGPFHHKQPHLQPMEEHKLKIRNNCSTSAQTLAEAMRQLEVQTRKFYPEIFNEIDSGAFVDMMILDGCFLIELLRLYETTPKGTVNHHYFPATFSLPKLQCELLMLENQLPLFVLEKLFDLTSQGNEPSLAQLALKFFDPLLHRGENFVTKLEVGGKHHHLLSLFHSSFLPSLKKDPHSVLTVTPDERWQSRHSAKKLTDAGIVLAKSENPNLLDIEFNRGVLKIPTLHLCRRTNLVLLNLIDYESSNPRSQKHFTDYVSFFSSLLQTEIDFDVLNRCGIVAGRYQEDVPRLFSNLCNEIDSDFDNPYLRDLLSNLRSYRGNRSRFSLRKMKKGLKFLFLVLAFVQTFFAVLAYFRPPS